MEARVNSAFPTVSNEVNAPKRSIFDKENVITAAVNYAVYSVCEKRNKARNGFVVVNTPVIEIHKSQKNSKNNKVAKHFVNLAEIFNVCIQKEPTHMKGDCLSLMDLSETYLIKPIDSEFTLEDWYEYVLEKCRALRSAKLIRSVFREEYFKASWDVVLSKKPKLRRDYNKHSKIEDLVSKHSTLEGRHRLCIHPDAILLFKMGATPTASIENPFEKTNFINLPLNVISSYGNQEKFFILRSGRFSEIGSGELWMFCGDGLNAKAVHDRIIEIVTREADRRQAQGVVRQNWPSTTNARTRKTRDRREDSQTITDSNAVSKYDSHTRLRIGTSQSIASPSRKNSNTNSAFSVSANKERRDTKTNTKLQDNQSETFNAKLKPISNSFTCKKSSLASLLPFRLSKLSIVNSPTVGELPSPSSAVVPPTAAIAERARHGGSTGNMSVSSRLASAPGSARPTSSGILSGLQLDKMSSGLSLAPGTANYNSAEDYMTYDAKDKDNFATFTKSLVFGNVANELRMNSTTFASNFTNNLGAIAPTRQFSVGSLTTPFDSNKRELSNEKDYLEMDENISTADIFEMQDVRTYISNSTESCWSPYFSEDASNNLRAYSLGSKPKPPAPVRSNHKNHDGEKASPVLSHSSIHSSPLRLRPNSNPSCVENSTSGSAYRRQALSIGNHSHHNVCFTQHAKLRKQEVKKPAVPTKQFLENDSPTIMCQSKEAIMEGSALCSSKNASLSNMNASVESNKMLSEKVKTCEKVLGSSVFVQSASAASCDNADSNVSDNFADLRKRAHSVGSKSWIKPTLRKISAKREANATAKNSNVNTVDNLVAEMRTRAGSASCGTGSAVCFDMAANLNNLNEKRRSSSRLNSTALRAIAAPNFDSQDHVEIDFDVDGSCPSIDSPSNRSRNSSFGVQLSGSMRSALDLALFSNCTMLNKPGQQDRYLESFTVDFLNRKKNKEAENVNNVQRKQSVPELKELNTMVNTSENALVEDLQNVKAKASETDAANDPSRDEHVSAAISGKNTDEDDDYVVMELMPAMRNTSAQNFTSSNSGSKLKSSNPPSCSRVISTIIESAYSSSSHSESSLSDLDVSCTDTSEKNSTSRYALFAIRDDESSGSRSPLCGNSLQGSDKSSLNPTQDLSSSSFSKKKLLLSDEKSFSKKSSSKSLTRQSSICQSPILKDDDQLTVSNLLKNSPAEGGKQGAKNSRRSSTLSNKSKGLTNFIDKSLDDTDYETIVPSPHFILNHPVVNADSTLPAGSNSPGSARRKSRQHNTSSSNSSGLNGNDITPNLSSSQKFLQQLHSTTPSHHYQECLRNKTDGDDLTRRKSSTSSARNLRTKEIKAKISNASLKSLHAEESPRKSNIKRTEKKSPYRFNHLTATVLDNKTCDYAIIEPTKND